MSSYQIIDEPKGGTLSKMTVDPMWPLLGFMLGGALFSWVWSAINSFALNSPNRNRELLIACLGVVSFVVIYVLIGTLWANGVLAGINPDYLKVGAISVELIFCYKLFLMQRNSFAIYEYFQGKVANPLVGLIIALVVGRKLEAYIIGLLLGMGGAQP